MCEVAEDSDSGPDVADPGAASLGGSGRYVKNLWPFARPIAQGTKLLQQLCHSETASRCVILSRTAHPGQVIACRTVRVSTITPRGVMFCQCLDQFGGHLTCLIHTDI